MPRPTFQLIGYDIRLDYITATSFPVDKRHIEFREFIRYLTVQLEGMEFERKPYNRGGYIGYSLGECSIGQRPRDAHMKIEVYGELTVFVAEELRKSGIAYKTTRADIRALTQGNEPNTRFGHQLVKWIERHDRLKKKKERTMIVPYFQGHGDSGISAHPRGGDWHLRIYDDEFKHQKIKGCSRWAIEGELRGVQATHFADMFKASTDDKGLMASVLATKLKNDGLNFPIFDELKAVKISGTKPTTDLDGKIFALRTTGSNQMAKVIEAERPAALIAWFRSNGWLDEQGRFLHGMATEEQIRDEQEIWVRDLEPRKNRVPELSEIQKEEIKELVRIAGHTRQLRSNPSKWIDEDPFSDE